MRNVYLLLSPFAEIRIRRFVMPLGLLVVAGSIRKSPRFGKDDRIYICDTFREVLARADAHKNDRLHFLVSAVGTIRNLKFSSRPAVQCLETLKRRYPEIISCVGGPDATLAPEDYLSHFDTVFQGEIGSVDVLEVLRSGTRIFQAPTADINAEPFDYGLLAGRRYLTASLQTTRGCPYNCAFCNVAHIFGHAIRSIEPANFEARLESLAGVHTGFVIMADDYFGGGLPDRMREILDVMIRFQERRGFPFIFAVQTAVQTSRHPDILRMMRKANIIAAYLGVESSSQDALDALDKKHNLGDPIADQVEAFTRNGMVPYLSMILGLEREAEDIGRRTRRFLEACGSPLLAISLIQPVPRSKIRAKAEADGRLLDHPYYSKYSLLPMKTDRPYEAIIKDYQDILAWFFQNRRLLSFCDRTREKIMAAHDQRVMKAFLSHIPRVVVFNGIVLYAGFCLKSGSLAGLLALFRMIGRPKVELFYFLTLRGCAFGEKAGYGRILRQVRKGMRKLKAAGLYPFENEANRRHIKNIT